MSAAASGHKGNKTALASKPCAVCGRPMSWQAPKPLDYPPRPLVQRVGAVLWPSFFAAGVATMVFFALVDPLELRDMTFPDIEISRGLYLDEATLIERFGTPGERLPVSSERVHLLYADKGLDIVVDAQGKELLQYVPPRDFARLREPLRQAESVPDATR